MKVSNIILAVLVGWPLAAPAQGADAPEVEIPEEREKFHVFLLAGQSNMAGRGEVQAQDREIHQRVMMLTRAGQWQHAVDPIHYDKKIAGAGLARSFAIELANLDEGITIGLVPAACGGSPIAAWKPGAYYEPTDSHPYDDAVVRARQAMRDGVLRGILWHQGEADAKRDDAVAYKDELSDLVYRFRNDLEAPEVPFIIGQLGRFEGQPWTEARHHINEAHIAAAAEIPFAGFVSSYGLTAKEDNVHFNTESLRDFGKRYARRYLQILQEGSGSGFH